MNRHLIYFNHGGEFRCGFIVKLDMNPGGINEVRMLGDKRRPLKKLAEVEDRLAMTFYGRGVTDVIRELSAE